MNTIRAFVLTAFSLVLIGAAPKPQPKPVDWTNRYAITKTGNAHVRRVMVEAR